MQITGEQALAHIEAADFQNYVNQVADDAPIDLDILFDLFNQHAQSDQLLRATLEVDGGIENGGTTLSLETNVINMPLRYVNQLKKMLYTEETYEVNIYAIIDSPFVSQSNLKIAYASSVEAYLDDPESVQAKIRQWFTEELAQVAENAREANPNT